MVDEAETGPGALPCSWCGRSVEAADGFRLVESPGDRHAVFCRLEHVVPWALRGAHWESGADLEPPADELASRCARCGEPLGEVRVVLVRHRGERSVADGFCSVDHCCEWAKAGGRYG